MIRFGILILLALFCFLTGATAVQSAEKPAFSQPTEFRNPVRSAAVPQEYQQAPRSNAIRPVSQNLRTNGIPAPHSIDRARTQAMPQGAGLEVRKTEANPITPLDRPQQSNSGSAGGNVSKRAPSIWGTFGALLVVISIILVGARLFKKHHPLGSAGLPREVMEVLGKKPLDARQTIHFVRCGSRILILGSSPAGLEMLSEVVDPVEVDLITGMCREGTESSRTASSFRNLFQGVQKKEESDFKRPVTESFRESDESESAAEQEVFSDYDSAVNRLQQKLLRSPRQSLNDRAESDHA